MSIILQGPRARVNRTPLLFRASDCIDEQGLFALSYGKKVYAVFSRVGGATMVDSRGRFLQVPSGRPRVGSWIANTGERRSALLIERPVTSLLTSARDFTAAAWSKSNVTVTANVRRAPDGTLTADRIEAATTAATNIRQQIIATSTTVTYSIFVYKGSGATDCNRFVIYNDTTGQTVASINFNYDTGAPSAIVGSARVEALVGENVGWWWIALTASAGITVGDQLAVYPGFVGSAETAGEHAFAWHAQLEPGEVQSMPTGVGTAAGVRNNELCYFPLALPAQELSMYGAGIERGTAALLSTTHHWLRVADASPRLIALRSGTRQLAAYVENGNFQSAASAQQIAHNDLLEFQVRLLATGAAQATVCVNRGAPIASAPSAVPSGGFPSAFGNPRLYLASASAAQCGAFAFASAVVSAGAPAFEELRELAGV